MPALSSQGKDVAAFAAQTRRGFWPALQMNWRIWTPLQFININYVPLQVKAACTAPWSAHHFLIANSAFTQVTTVGLLVELIHPYPSPSIPHLDLKAQEKWGIPLKSAAQVTSAPAVTMVHSICQDS